MMADPPLTDADELAHRPGPPDPNWEEAWYFDFVAAEGRVAGYARLGLRPAEGRAWWWTALVGKDLPYVLAREHDVDPPKPGTLEIRAAGLWAEPICEAPFDHWSVGLEAFALAFDDPAEAYGAERGDPMPLGLDLGWEADGGPLVRLGPTGYQQSCAVHGEVLVGRQRLVVDGHGCRTHVWGVRDWWGGPATWAAGHYDDGTALAAAPSEAQVEVNGEGLVAAATLGSLALRPVAHAPLQIPAPDRASAGPAGPAPSRLVRALCRAEPAEGSGPGSWAWVERLQPAWSTTP